MTIKELHDSRQRLITEMRGIIDGAKDGKLTADETSKYEALDTRQNEIKVDIDRAAALKSAEDEVRASQTQAAKPAHRAAIGAETVDDGTPEARKLVNASPEYRQAFDAWARKGKSIETRDLEVGTDSEGGYLVPDEWDNSISQKLTSENFLRSICRVIKTAGTRNFPLEASAPAAAWVDEEGTYAGTDPAFGNFTISAYKLGQIVKISEELLEDNAFNLEGYLSSAIAKAFGVAEETAFVTGNGTLKPTGLTSSSITGVTGAVSATAVITGNDLIDVYYNLKRAYRSSASWVISDGLAKLIRKLKDDNGQYIWQAGIVAGTPDRILGRPVYTSDDMAAPAVSAVTAFFGDFSYYLIADRGARAVQRLVERYADTGQVGYRVRQRLDGKVLFTEAFSSFTHGAAS